MPTSDGSASKGKQQTSEPVHILKRSFARTVSAVSSIKNLFYFLQVHSWFRKLKDVDVEIMMVLCLLSQVEVRYTDRIFYFLTFSEDFILVFNTKYFYFAFWGTTLWYYSPHTIIIVETKLLKILRFFVNSVMCFS